MPIFFRGVLEKLKRILLGLNATDLSRGSGTPHRWVYPVERVSCKLPTGLTGEPSKAGGLNEPVTPAGMREPLPVVLR